MKIAVIGAGKVGGALGSGLSKQGHELFYGVKEGSQPLAGPSKGQIVSVRNAIESAEFIFLTVPWKAAKEVAESVSDWRGKILVDCTNPIKPDFSGLEIGQTTSGGELVQGWAKGARVVKCFNQTGYENMADPNFGSHKPVMFAAGDDAASVKTVAGVAGDFGFEVVELPALALARQLEQLAWLWIFTAFKTSVGRSFAFGLLRK